MVENKAILKSEKSDINLKKYRSREMLESSAIIIEEKKNKGSTDAELPN